MQGWKIGAFMLCCGAMPVCAQAMTVSDWVQRMEALKARGSAAKGSPELMALQTEVASAAVRYRAQIKEAKEKAQRPRACPPVRVSLSSEDLMLEFRKLPPASYAGEVSVAFGEVMDKRYPCGEGQEVAPPRKAPTI